MLEQTIQNRARLALSQEQLGVYWRANVGQAWASNEVYKISGPAHAQSFTLFTGDMVLRGARPFDTGLPKGFSDLFGITPVIITPEMVLLTAVTGRLPPEVISHLIPQILIYEPVRRVIEALP